MLENKLEQEKTFAQSTINELERQLKKQSDEEINLLKSQCAAFQRELSQLKREYAAQVDELTKTIETEQAQRFNNNRKTMGQTESVTQQTSNGSNFGWAL